MIDSRLTELLSRFCNRRYPRSLKLGLNFGKGFDRRPVNNRWIFPQLSGLATEISPKAQDPADVRGDGDQPTMVSGEFRLKRE